MKRITLGLISLALAGLLFCNFKSSKCPVDVKMVKYQTIKKYSDLTTVNKKYIEWIANQPLVLEQSGKPAPLKYRKYGKFIKTGTAVKFRITKRRALRRAVGEGIYPNWSRIRGKEEFRKLQATGLFQLNQWNKIFLRYPKLGFYRWAIANDNPGVKQFYIAVSLEKLGLYEHALKAYQALFYNFPKTLAYTQWQTLWYPGLVARDKIDWILRRYSKSGYSWEGSEIYNPFQFDNIKKNDKFYVKPGKLVKKAAAKFTDKLPIKLRIKKTIGKGKVKLVQYQNGHWQYIINGKPTMIKAMSYVPNKIGRYPNGKYRMNIDFFQEDSNKNGIIDALFESYIDKNKNGKKDADEPRIGDMQLLKDMGCNTLRLYHTAKTTDPKLLRKLHEKYGLYYIVGDFAGMYGIGSGANWKTGTDYNNPKHVKAMLNSIRNMVNRYKDQPYVIMWMIGNESNYPVANNAAKIPDAFYKFVNRAAKLIKKLDPLKRPVGYSNGDLGLLNYFEKHCKDVDVLGANVYRDPHGFGRSFFEAVKRHTGRPVIITEFGVCAYSGWHDLKTAEQYQADYHRNHWMDLIYHSAGHYGTGNALGGVVFEFVDEWWKHEGDEKHRIKDRKAHASIHDTQSSFPLTGMDGLSYEEWFGLFSQGKGTDSPFLRIPRKAYYVYKDLWNRY